MTEKLEKTEININRNCTALHEIMHYYSSYVESIYVCLWGASQIFLFAKYIYSDQVEDKLGMTRTTHAEEPDCIEFVRLLWRSTLCWEYNIKNGTYRNKMGRYGLDSFERGIEH